VQPETAATLTESAGESGGSGQQAAGVAGYAIAGKSGTAQIPTEEGYTDDETIVTFVGYAPADDPQFVILVKLDRPDPNISPGPTTRRRRSLHRWRGVSLIITTSRPTTSAWASRRRPNRVGLQREGTRWRHRRTRETNITQHTSGAWR
jgi:hypothetical protein